MLGRILVLTGLMTVAACGYVDEYEEAVYDHEPVYCYQSIGKVVCFNEPYHRDADRLVNYYGPHPSRYDAPDAPEAMDLIAPPQTNVWVKDPEPVVTVSGVASVAPVIAPPQVPNLDVSEPNWLFDTILAPASESAAPAPSAAAITPVQVVPLAPAQ